MATGWQTGPDNIYVPMVCAPIRVLCVCVFFSVSQAVPSTRSKWMRWRELRVTAKWEMDEYCCCYSLYSRLQLVVCLTFRAILVRHFRHRICFAQKTHKCVDLASFKIVSLHFTDFRIDENHPWMLWTMEIVNFSNLSKPNHFLFFVRSITRHQLHTTKRQPMSNVKKIQNAKAVIKHTRVSSVYRLLSNELCYSFDR